METKEKEVMGYTESTVDNILKPNKLENPFNVIIELCKKKGNISWKSDGYYDQFRHLLQLMGEESVNRWINGNIDYLSQFDYFNVCSLHATMHKNLRQADCFSAFNDERDGNLDMILYALMNMGDYTFNVLMEALVDRDNIKKWEVVRKELKE